MAEATTFHLVRHARTLAVDRALSGRTAVPLSAEGEREAAGLAHALASLPITAVLSSPQQRTQQTARAAADAHGLAVQTEAALDEVDFGPWTGQDFAALAGRADWAAWNASRSLAAAPGCETMLQVQARACALLVRLHAGAPGGHVVLVSHADVLRSVLAWALGMPIDLMQRLEIAPALRSVVVLGDAGVRVRLVNG